MLNERMVLAAYPGRLLGRVCRLQGAGIGGGVASVTGWKGYATSLHACAWIRSSPLQMSGRWTEDRIFYVKTQRLENAMAACSDRIICKMEPVGWAVEEGTGAGKR